jgi:serine/threonine protein kinase
MPYAMLGSLLNILRIRDKLSATDVESIAILTAAQMLKCLDLLLTVGILHTDIKPDNWVLRWNDQTNSLKVCLIDFGKACPSRLNVGKDLYAVSYKGSYAAKGICAIPSDVEWSYEVRNNYTHELCLF